MITKKFVTAGKAVLTVSNPQGEHYTYRVRPMENGDAFFVSVLTAPEQYTYLGVLRPEEGRVVLTKASTFTKEAKAYRVADWAFRHIWAGRDLPPGYVINHAGHCGRCGRTLTHPESIQTGLGPECAGKA